ncbi:2,3-dimethylmalate lyase [Mycobacterium kansasii 824]|nr:2,3-dimethylmalate lyase [Mycobacterium kansasii 824]
MPTTPARRRLRALLDTRELIVAPGVFDGISAHLTKRTGHVAAYLTGSGVAASGYGLPDIGLVTASEMAERARMIVGVLGDIPLIADADTGYGAPKNVVRTVRSYDNAGVAAIQLEDQVFPKRCGHLPDKRVVDAAVFEQTLAAALDARTDDGLLVVARTDARPRSAWTWPSNAPTGLPPLAPTSSSSKLRRASVKSSASHVKSRPRC